VTVEGLDGLSIGRLAQITGVPKRSVHALFGSKEELQLATVNAARESFIREVVGPALAGAEPGRDRLLALCDGYLSYVQRRIFPEGCFFVAASAEVGARAGRVHDEVARVQQQWRDLLGREARVAADKGQLASDTDPAQLAFELGVILAGTNIVSVLHDDADAIARARGGRPHGERVDPPAALAIRAQISIEILLDSVWCRQSAGVSSADLAPCSRSQDTTASLRVSGPGAMSRGVCREWSGMALMSAPRTNRNSAVRRCPPWQACQNAWLISSGLGGGSESSSSSTRAVIPRAAACQRLSTRAPRSTSRRATCQQP